MSRLAPRRARHRRPSPALGRFAALVVLAAAACGGTTDPEPAVPGAITLVGAAPAAARIGDTVRVGVRVTTSGGRALAGQGVVFSTSDAGGLVLQPTALTDAAGEARTTWVLGTTVGVQQLVARVGALPVTVDARVAAGAPRSLAAQRGDGQTAVVGTPVVQPPAVVVRDVAGNPVAGTRVVFRVASGGGRLVGDTTTTGDDGIATAGGWTLGTRTGVNTLDAQLASAPSPPAAVTFTAVGTASAPARLEAVSAPSVAAVVTSWVDDEAPRVRVTDAYGNPVPAATVLFARSGAGGATQTVPAVTDPQGVATMRAFQLDTVARTESIVASVGAVPPATFTVVARAGAPTLLEAIRGTSQIAAPGVPLAAPLVARVSDRYRNPVAGVVVRFVGTGVGLTIPAPLQTTNGDGEASASGVVVAARVPDVSVRAAVEASGATVALPSVDFGVHLAVGPITTVKWSWDVAYAGILQTTSGRRTDPVDFRLYDDIGQPAFGTLVRVEVVPAAAAGTVYQFTTNAVTAVTTVTSQRPATVLQAETRGFVGFAAIRLTLPNGLTSELPFFVNPSP